MRNPVNGARIGFSALCLLFALPVLAADGIEPLAGGGRAGDDRWIPGIHIDGGTLFQKADASGSTGPVLGPSFPNPNPRQPIRPSTNGDDLMVTPVVGVGLELLTPRFAEGAWVPRFFARAGVSGAFGPDRDIAKESVIRTLAVPPELAALSETAVTGQGSRTRVSVKPMVVRAGAGVQFPFEWLGRRVGLRFSFEYLREEIKGKGAVRRAVCIVSNATGGCGARGVDNGGGGVDDFRQLDLRATEEKSYHGIGPGLELETEAGRLGPFVPSIAIGAQAYHFLGDREFTWSATNQFGETASFRVKKERWAFRGGVGVRFRWQPE